MDSAIYQPSPAREQEMVRAIRDHAARYARSLGGDPVRYVWEGHLRAPTTRDEYEWIKAYIADHPEVLDIMPLSYDELAARDRHEYAEALAEAGRIANRAHDLYSAGDPDGALALIDQAEGVCPKAMDWGRIRGIITDQTADTHEGA